MNRPTERGARKHTFTRDAGIIKLNRFNSRNHILTAIREGRVELAIARKNALAGAEDEWEEVTRLESEIEILNEIIRDIYL